jgi:hypothetical protein
MKHYIRSTHYIRHAAVVCCQLPNECLEIRHECLFPHPSNPPLTLSIFKIRTGTAAALALRQFSDLQCNPLSFSIQLSSGFRNAGPGVYKTAASGCSGECCCQAVTHPRTNQAQRSLNCSWNRPITYVVVQGVFKKRLNFCYKDFTLHFKHCPP